jgi:hypothetical protein
MLKALRPPYGSWDERTRRVASSLGYRHVVLWDVDTRDWARDATVASVVRRGISGRRGSIVLMHCGPRITALALPAIIRSYKTRGFRLVGLDELLGKVGGSGSGLASKPSPKPSASPAPVPSAAPPPASRPEPSPGVSDAALEVSGEP